MFKAVVFDLFETLITENGVAVPRAGALGEFFGIDPKAFRTEWKQLRPLVLRGQLSFKGALLEVTERLEVVVPESLIQQACDDRARAKAVLFQRIDATVLTLVRELSERGVRLAVISNCMAEDVVEWPGSSLAAHFSCAQFSFEAGMVKPDPRMYLDVVEQMAVKPEETLFIGDGGDDELAGARSAGVRAAQAGWFVSRVPAPEGVPVCRNPQDVTRLALSGRLERS